MSSLINVGLFLRGSFDDIGQVINLSISKLAILAGIQFLLYAAEWAAPDYFVDTLRLEHVEGGKLFRLSNALMNALSHFRVHKLSEKKRMH